jgi:large subunit ribosomal protein L18
MKRSTFLKRKSKILRRDNRFKANSFRVYFFKSNKHYYASLIDNNTGNVLFSLTTQKVSSLDKTSLERITDLAKAFANLVSGNVYSDLSFDRGVYRFHGLVKHFVEQVRFEGVKV